MRKDSQFRWLENYNARIVSWQNDLGSFSASLQAKSVVHHSTEAKKLLPKDPDGALEPASAEARKGFDTGGTPAGHLDAAHVTGAVCDITVKSAVASKSSTSEMTIFSASQRPSVYPRAIRNLEFWAGPMFLIGF